jgi:hypothetical protein
MNQVLSWQHAQDGRLMLKHNDRSHWLPDGIAAWLRANTHFELTADPASDVLALETRLRGMASELAEEITRAERRVQRVREAVVTGASPWWSRAARRKWSSAQAELTTAVNAHTALVSAYEQARGLQIELRQYVIDLEVPSGLLAEAACGWRRSAAVPASVTVFDSEEQFVLGDTRRASEWNGPGIGGDILGHGWRRDGDDDTPDCLVLDRAGPWMLGYIPRTREVYASRRSSYQPGQVWLLGTDIGHHQAHALVDELEPRCREPNSLILFAHKVARIRRDDQVNPVAEDAGVVHGERLSSEQPIGPPSPVASPDAPVRAGDEEPPQQSCAQ